MSDVQKLKDAVEEYRKAKKNLDDKLNKIAENNRQSRQAQEESQTRQG